MPTKPRGQARKRQPRASSSQVPDSPPLRRVTDPVYAFSVRSTRGWWEVVRTIACLGHSTVVYRGLAEYEAHGVAQALVHYATHDGPAEPMRPQYEVSREQLVRKMQAG